MKVAVIGLGLIGGSLAKSTKFRTAHTVYGIDLDSDTMMMARMCGAIDAPLTDENLPDCDLILVLDEGRIIGAGSHKHLMATCAEYKEISDSQMGGAFID